MYETIHAFERKETDKKSPMGVIVATIIFLVIC